MSIFDRLGRLFRGFTSRAEAPGPDDLVELAVADGTLQADMWRGMLESAGIPSVVKGAPVEGIVPFGVPRLFVRQRDLRRAKRILAEVDASARNGA